MTLAEKIAKIKSELEMDWISVFDIEVYKFDWLVVVYDLNLGGWFVFWDNDVETLKAFIENNQNIMIGFNNKNYDNPLVAAMCKNYDTVTIKNISDRIVNEGIRAWDLDECKGVRFPSADLFDDCYIGTSLKGFEAHMGMNIVECEIPFDIDRKLTEEEKADVERYCKNDVEATIHMLYERIGYLSTKINLGARKSIPAFDCLFMTNAKLTAKYLGAVKQDHDDAFDYQFPDNILYEYIDKGVIDFFKTIKAGDLLLEDKAKSYTGFIGKCEFKVGAGGIHGSNGIYNMQADDDYRIFNIDVNQFYPSMIVENGYLSRNVPNPDDYKAVTVERLEAKKRGDKKNANCLKLVNNTTFGATKNQYNDLYDPLMALSICLSGQLYLLELATHLYVDTNCEIIQLNTDGIMLRIHKDYVNLMRDIVHEWESRTGFSMEADQIDLIVQKDVNNYLERQTTGNTKIKGGMLVRGISYVGAFKINNNACIVPTAVQKWFFEGVPVEDTINACDDIFQFQIIAKASSKYKNCVQARIICNEIVYQPTQKCNRVYASKDWSMGTLFKQKSDTSNYEKIAGLPDYCVIDNANELTIDSINKSWYIEEARKVVKAFTQDKIQGDLFTMATKNEKELVEVVAPAESDFCLNTVVAKPQKKQSNMDVFSKLLKARIEFSRLKIQPSGYNGHANFDYFELADIVPAANAVFEKNGLLLTVSFTQDTCEGRLTNYEAKDDWMLFSIPLVHIKEPAKFRMNEIQALGAEITYMRRYMYMIVLDIVVDDSIDSDNKEETPAVAPAKASTPAKAKVSVPATSATRAEIKKDLTKADGTADELQVKALKDAIKKWLKAKPEAKATINDIYVKTKKFTAISRAEADKLLSKINAEIEA